MGENCDICQRPFDGGDISRCTLCGKRFHMAWSVDTNMENCGYVWFNRSSCGMAFACKTCVAANPALQNAIVEIHNRSAAQ